MGDLAKRTINPDGITMYDRNYARGLTYARTVHKDTPLPGLMALLAGMAEQGTGTMDLHDRAWRRAEMDVLGQMIRDIQLLTTTTEEDL